MNINVLELDNDIKTVPKRKQYIEGLIAKTSNPDIVVLPELALCSYMANTDIWQYADDHGADTAAWAMEMAGRYNTYVAVGYLERSNGDYYNSYLLADKDRVYGNVRKSEGEAYIFKRGDFPHIIQAPFGNIAVAICYDARRKHFYQSIKDEKISLILFPHGCPSDPKEVDNEQWTIDYICREYQSAFGVPVVFVNSRGKLDYMMGVTGKMMMKAGFCLNGMSAIYTKDGVTRSNGNALTCCRQEAVLPQERNGEIPFYGEDLVKGNWLFRKFVLGPDIKRGIKFYETYKGK